MPDGAMGQIRVNCTHCMKSDFGRGVLGLSRWFPVNSLYIKLPRCLGQTVFSIDSALSGWCKGWSVWAVSFKSALVAAILGRGESSGLVYFVMKVVDLVFFREVKCMWLNYKMFYHVPSFLSLLVLWQKPQKVCADESRGIRDVIT